jgi:hypothetical protein
MSGAIMHHVADLLHLERLEKVFAKIGVLQELRTDPLDERSRLCRSPNAPPRPGRRGALAPEPARRPITHANTARDEPVLGMPLCVGLYLAYLGTEQRSRDPLEVGGVCFRPSFGYKPA